MAIIGSAYVEIRALDTNLQRDIDKAMKKVKEPLITLQSNVNLTPVRDKIRVLREELKRNPLKFSAEVDLDRVHEHLDASYELYRDTPLQMHADVDHAPVEAALESIRTRYAQMTSTINTNADTAAAEAQIDFTARNRRSRIDVMGKIDPEYQKALKGLFYTLTGALPADKIKSAFVGLASNLEMASISAAKMLTIVGSVSSAVLTLGADVFTLGGDLMDVVGIAALAPAVFLGFGAAIATVTMAWKGFGTAISGKGKKGAAALAGLPPEAQDAAIAMRGLGKSIKEAAQGSYWKEMGTALQKMTDSTVPKLRDGLKGTGTSMALMTKGLLSSVKGFADSGKMDTFFQHLNAGLANASKGVKPFFDAIFTLGTVGSKHLEKMGISAANLGIRFNNWITAAEKSGKIDIWIASAKKAFGDLNRVLGGTVDTFKGLTAASRISGGKGLTEFATGMQNIAKTVNGEPFKSRLVTILLGARRGTDALSNGFGKVKKVIGDSSTAISGFLSLAGSIGGSFLNNFSKMFEGTNIGAGLITGLYGFKKAVDSMAPAFKSIGKMIGDLGQISATLFEQMAPGFNNLMDTLQKVISAVKDGVIKAMPVFNEFVQNILQVMAPIVIGIAQAFGDLLSAFSGLPGGLQNVIMAFGLMLLLKPKLDKFLQSMSYRMDRWKTSLGETVQRSQGFRTQMSDNFRAAGTAAGTAGTAIGKSLGDVRDSFRNTGKVAGDALRTTFGQLKTKYGPSMSEFGAGVKNGFKQAFTISPDLKAGFKRDITEPFQAVGKGIATVGRAIGGELKMVADHSKAYFSELPANAKKTWQNLPQIAKEEFTGVKNTIGYHMGEAADKVRDRSIYASKHLEDAGNGIKTAVANVKAGGVAMGKAITAAVSDVKAGSAAMGNHIRAMVSPVEGAVMKSSQAVAKSYNGMVLAGTISGTVLKNNLTPTFSAISNAAGKIFKPIIDGAATVASAAKVGYGRVAGEARSAYDKVSSGAKASYDKVSSGARSAYDKVNAAASASATAAGAAIGRAHQAVATGYNNMVLASTVAGTAMGRRIGDAATSIGTHATNISGSMGRAFSAITTSTSNAAAAIGKTASNVGSAFSKAASSVKTTFSPVGAAIRESFSTIGSNLRPAVTAVGELGTAAGGAIKSIGATAGAGLRSAATGLLGAFGGPWGIAIAAAGVAMALIGENAAKSKADVEKLAGMLDQTSGKMTGASTLEATKKLFDGPTNSFDDFSRGVFQNSKSVTETLDTLGISTKKYSDTMLDPKGRTAMVDGMHDVAFALKHARPITDEMAASIGTTRDKLEGMNLQDATKLGDSLEWAAGKATGMAGQIDAAQKMVRDLAAATGVNSAEAAILAKNYDTLSLSTSSANDKFLALKENLQILSTEQEKKQLGEKGYQQTLRDTAKGIQSVRDENNGLVTNLFDVKKGFDFTKQAGSDLHTTLQNQTDGILQIGTAALDKATKNGADANAANKAATDAMAKPIADLKQNLRDMKFTEPQIQGIIDTMNLMPKDLQAAISLKGGEEARKEIALTALASTSFAQGNYSATLAALPQAAKTAIEEATGLAGAFANKDFQTILTALDQTGPGKEAVLASLLTVTGGNYAADLKANDVTKVGVDAANKTMLGLTPPPPVMLQAKDATQKPVSFLQGALARISTTTASATVTITDKASGQVARIQQAVTSIKGAAPKITITDLATGKVATIDGKIQGLKGKTPTISISDKATSPIQGIKSWLDSLKDKTFTVTTIQNTRDGGKGANGGIVRSTSNMFGGSLSLARVKAFANGGVEKHIAQISAGQTPYRVWSEPETGGEAYIPLSKAKRGRSTKILEEVAKMFGMTLLKTKSFANGGVEGGSSAGGSSAGSLSTTHVSSALLNSVAKEMMKDNTNLNKIGEFVVDGIIGGVNNKSGAAVNTMTDMAGSLEDAVRTRLEIHSPSKTFLGLGKHIVDGLTVGIKDNTPAVQKRIATLANQIYVAASDIQKATGRSIGSSMAMLNHQKTLNVAWKKMPVWKYADQIVDYYQKTGKTGNRTLADIVRAREDVNVRLAAANKKLSEMQTVRADTFKAVSSQIRGEYKLGTSIVGQDKPYIPKMKFSDVMNYTAGMANRLRAFNGKIAALRKKGIAPGLINEVAMLGSIEGTSVADAMLQGTSAEVKNLNSQYSQVGAMSNAIGNTTADAMYKVGIDAQAGLVKGLQADSASLTSAANKLTGTLIAQVKKNLGIRSPSRVFAELGRFTGAGFIQGLDQMQTKLDRRVDTFINLDPRQVNTTGSTGVTTSAVAAGPSRDITVNVHPSPGMDETEVGKAAVRELGWQLLSQ